MPIVIVISEKLNLKKSTFRSYVIKLIIIISDMYKYKTLESGLS
jgi:hypothetical protein